MRVIVNTNVAGIPVLKGLAAVIPIEGARVGVDADGGVGAVDVWSLPHAGQP